MVVECDGRGACGKYGWPGWAGLRLKTLQHGYEFSQELTGRILAHVWFGVALPPDGGECRGVKIIIPLCLLSVLSVATLFEPAAAKGDETAKTDLGPADPETEALIGELANVSEPDAGYCTTSFLALILPDEDSMQKTPVFLKVQCQWLVESDVLERIVRRGAVAVPSLLRHLGDAQKTKIPPYTLPAPQINSLMAWMDFADEYDYNQRIRKTNPPVGVNRDRSMSTMFPMLNEQHEQQPREHTITVGDLCFVALGKIVNRSFNASRYAMTAGTVINSPSYSKALRDAVEADFSDFTPAKHRELLTQDFLEPDSWVRRVGAMQRLALYYPEILEPLILKQLAAPTYDLFKTYNFVRKELYPEKSPEKRKIIFDDFLKKNGQQYSDGIELQLFWALDSREPDIPLPKDGTYDPRALLVQLYGFKDDVSIRDKPDVDIWDWGDLAQFIGGIGRFKSTRVDDAVYGIFSKIKESDDCDFLATACMGRLVGGSHDQEFRDYCERRMSPNEYAKGGLLGILDQLDGRYADEAGIKKAEAMEKQADAIVYYQHPYIIGITVPRERKQMQVSSSDFDSVLADATPKRDLVVVIMGVQMRAKYYDGAEKLDAELDKIEASLKAKGFKRVVFEVMSKLGRQIYRE